MAIHRPLAENHNLEMQKQFCFVDTEANRHYKEQDSNEHEIKGEEQTLRLGVAQFKNREVNYNNNNGYVQIRFKIAATFWNSVEQVLFNDDWGDQIIIFAHNMEYDFNMLDGLHQLTDRGWELTKKSLKRPFLLEWVKEGKTIKIWDTTNYFRGRKLEDLGEALDIPKLDVNFDKASKEELFKYCERDVDILRKTVMELIKFLQIHDFSRLMPTASSLALNIFRHKFYPQKDEEIWIHKKTPLYHLERQSYRGGFTDVLRYGEFDEHITKLDVNSMYPSIMRDNKLPVKAICYCNCKHKSQSELKQLIRDNLCDDRGVIANVSVTMPEDNGWLLNTGKVDNEEKCIRLAGKFTGTFASPEVQYILDHGKINNVYSVAVYKMANMFDDYVEEMYSLRKQYQDENNDLYETFVKLLMNSLYGKFGEHKIVDKVVGETEDVRCEAKEVKSPGLGLHIEMSIGHKIFVQEQKAEPARNALIPIASFVTAYGRMKIVNYIEEAGRENCNYTDTDCIAVNDEGYDRLNHHIDEQELGKLDIEDEANYVGFYRPKFYDFGDKRKCKGVTSDAEKIREDETEAVYCQQQWQGMKKAFKKGEMGQQMIEVIKKQMSKEYDKGRIDDNKYTRPFVVNQSDQRSSSLDVLQLENFPSS